MKIRMKALAAAALLAASGMASATITLPSTGDGELFLVAYDPLNLVTYVKDIGTAISGFSGGATGSLLTLDGWSSFTAALNSNLANVRWGVLAGDGVAPISTLFTATTAIGNGSSGSTISQSAISRINGAIGSISNAHNSLATQSAVANGWSVQTSTTNDTFQGALLFGPSNNNNGTNLTVSGTLADDLYFYSFTNGTSLNSTRTAFGNALGQGKWVLDETAATLQYTAPVPEPGTYALMMAGLLTLGAVARRRTK